MNYLLQVNLFWVLLYGCYWLVLRRHTFFVLNRAYLLGSLLLAFVLPLVKYPEALPPMPVFHELAPSAEMAATEVGNADILTENYPAGSASYAAENGVPPVAPLLGWREWLGVLYLLGMLFMTARLLRQLRKVLAFTRRGTFLDMEAYRLYLLDDEVPGEASPGSFSFLNHIVITRRDYEENFDTVLSHELAHVRQRHSWDILLVEVLRMFFWFNPVLVFYKKSLQQVHEYLADCEVCEWDAIPRDRYAAFMLSYALASPKVSHRTAQIVNLFFKTSLLKNRIAMLYKNKNSNWSLGKYAAVALLMAFISLAVASCDQQPDKDVEQTTALPGQSVMIEGVILDKEDQPLPGAIIVVKGTQTGTTTTAQGEFRIMAPAGSELDFSFMGFKKASLKMPEQGFVRVVMAKENASEPSLARRVSGDIGRLEMAHRAESEILTNSLKDSVFTVVATNPQFPGGIKAMYQFVQDNMKYPAAARRAKVQGKVFLTFVVNADGSIQDIKVLKGMGFGTDEEAIRIMKNTPKWKPGSKENGEKVRVKYNLPINFVLPEEKKAVGRAKAEEAKPAVAERRSSFNAGVDSLIGLKPRTRSLEEAARFKPPVKYERENDPYKDIFKGKDLAEIIRIAISGKGFLNSENPLIVLDGVISSLDMPDFLNSISPENVKSVEVIKGDRAQDSYGVKGANGVVRVTTKQGAKMPLNKKN